MPLPRLAARILADALAPLVADWSESRERVIRSLGRPLDPELLGFAGDLGIAGPERIRVHLTPRIPLPLPNPLVDLARRAGLPVFHPAGMALGLGITAVEPRESLLRHELVHVHQYQRLGGHRPFMRRYLFECLHLGYPGAPLEIEARERSSGR
jgi:hypothetical protein